MRESDELRRAAALMRQRAEAATPGRWKLWGMTVMADQDGTSNVETAVSVAQTFSRNRDGKLRTWDADHIASWHPGVALAVADWLDREAGQADRCYGDPEGGAPIYGAADPAAFAVARAYLGHDTEAAER